MAFDPITAVLNVGNTLIDRLLPDKSANDAAKAQLLQMQLKGDLDAATAQIEVNKAEATNTNWFVAGWRPYIGWICGSGLAYQFLGRPFAQMVLGIWHRTDVTLVNLDMGTLMVLLTGMLGLGGMRTVEKIQGIAETH